MDGSVSRPEWFLEAEDLHLAFGGIQELSGVSLRVEKGKISAVIGPNGAGKTSLFNTLSGFYRPQRGRILLEGRDISTVSANGRAAPDALSGQCATHPRQQDCLAGLAEHLGAVIARASVHAQTHRHTVVEHPTDWCDPAGEPHVAAGAVRNAGAGGSKKGHSRFVELHAVCMPDIGSNPAEVSSVLRWGPPKALQTVGQIVIVLGQMGVQTHAVPAGKCGVHAHQVPAHAEGLAWCKCDLDHRTVAWIVISRNDALALAQDCVFGSHQLIPRKAAG
jgi:energy-coupling factor transporter ATP-binding protein EcfA2